MTSSSDPARPASPSNSFYALSDDEEGDYNTITHTTTGRGVKLLYSKSKASHPARIPLRRHQLTHSLGLHPPHPFRKRQHPRLHRPPPTETTSFLPSFILLLDLCPLKSSLFPPPSLASRILPRRRPQHLRQSRPLRRRLAPETIIPRSSSPNNHSPLILHRALCLCYPSLSNLQPAGAAA